MNKSCTLYITDLDGTLLNSQSAVPDESIKIINALLEKGMRFTVATARTPATVVPLLQQLKLDIPAILMNGAVLYDVQHKRYIHTHPFTDDSAIQYTSLLESRGLVPFVYRIDENMLHVFHEPLNNDAQRQFKRERENSPYKEFITVGDYKTVLTGNPPLFLLVIDRLDRLQTAAAEIERIGNCSLYCYQDVLNPTYGNLEIYPRGVSKAATAQLVVDQLNPWEVVAFGDNLNDLPLFARADRRYATANALDEVKRQANAVIDSHDNNGVARFLLQDFLGE